MTGKLARDPRNARRESDRRRRRRLHPALLALEDRRLLTALQVTNTLASGPGSLAAAINTADNNGLANTITFTGTIWNAHQTILLEGSQLLLSSSAGTQTITGPAAGVSVSGNSLSRVLEVNAGVTASISGLTFTGGSSGTGAGGGLYNMGATTLSRCTISFNSSGTSTAGGIGGGVDNTGTLTLIDCTINGNTAGTSSSRGYGGGLNNASGTATLTDCTVSGNTAVSNGSGVGGGLRIVTGAVAVTNCTITGNAAGSGGGIFNGGANTTLTNTIVAGNTTVLFGSTASDIGASSNVSGSSNLIGTGGGGGLVNGVGGNQVGVATTLLTSLGDYGGPTQTVALQPGSPAIGKGTSSGITTDQRGFALDSPVDIGAFQFQSSPALTVGSVAGGPSTPLGALDLPAAVKLANLLTGSHTITFDPTVFATPQTIILTGGQLTLTDTTGTETITGPAAGVTLSGNNVTRVLQVNANVTASISGMTITGGKTSGNGGGLAIYGTATLSNCTLSGNSAIYSGGGLLDSRPDGIISGGVYGGYGGGLYNRGTATLTNCTVSGNSASYGGGLAGNAGTITLTDCTVSGNSAGSAGGVLANTSGKVTIGNTIVAGNTANTAPDAEGTFTSGGHNLIGKTNGSTGWVGSDLTGTSAAPLNAGLAPLSYYGGPTETVGLFVGSPAIDAGSNALVPSGITTDQRGASRVANGTVDIGAFEAQPAITQSYVVNTTADTTLFYNGSTTLRDAIGFENVSASQAITFDPTVFATAQTITLTGGQLTLTGTSGTETITGPAAGVTVSGNNANRVFQVNASVAASISGLTIAAGNTAFDGGGVLSYGTLTLTNCTLSGNSALNGGALWKDGTATLTGCTINGNSAANHAAGINNDSGTTTLNNCILTGNSAVDGGALFNYTRTGAPGTTTLTSCTVSGNAAFVGGGLDNVGTLNVNSSAVSGNNGGYGGGIWSDGTLNLTSATVSGNNAFGNGGGLLCVNGTNTLTGSTISGNTAYGNTGGGGMWLYGGTSKLTNCTVSGNFAGSAGGGLLNTQSSVATLTDCTFSGNSSGSSGGGVSNSSGTVTIGNTILAGNVATTSGPDAFGTVSSSGHNLVGKTDGSTGWVASDLTGTVAAPLNALLTTLGNFGGPTQTIGLFVGSPAINAGSNALIPSGVTTDQRGLARIVNGTVDIGAFEAQPAFVPSYVVNTTADEIDFSNGTTSLREAIASANAFAGHTITFDTTVFATAQTITLAGSQLVLAGTSGTETITGPAVGVTVSGNNTSRVFEVNPGVTASISGLTITSGTAPVKGGGLLSYGALTLANCTVSGNSAGFGGGVWTNASTLTLTTCTLSGNFASQNGGAIDNGSTLSLNNCNITGNAATHVGGGLFNYSGLTSLTNCTLSGNSAAYGGGVWSRSPSSLTLTGCTVSGNTGNFGAGLDNVGPSMIVNNSTIRNNTSNLSGGGGGGVYNYGSASFTNCTISGNAVAGALGSGGGLQAEGKGTLTLQSCTLSGNSVGYNGGALVNYGATVVLNNCTVSGNSSALTGGGLAVAIGSSSGSITLTNTIVAGNTASTSGPDALGTFASGGHNLIGKTNGSSGWVGSDLTGTIAVPLSAMLATLGYYGGTTQTMALLPGSPALSKGAGSSSIATDQRGAARATSGAIDIGAFQDEGYTVAVASGSGQSATINTVFANPLAAVLTENFANSPIPGATLSFTPPGSGASAALSIPSATNASGQASVTATANATTGSYTVTASATGVASMASFSLTNTNPNQPVIQLSDGGVYNGLAFTATATITPNDGPPSNKLMGVGITLTYYVGTGTGGTNLGSAAPINAGTYTVVASYPGAGQYLSAGAQATFTITPKTLSVSGLSASNKTYDATTTATLIGTAALLTAEAAGGSTADGKPYTGDTVSLISAAAAAFTGTFASKDVASAIVVTVTGNSLTGAQAGDYVLSSTNEESGLTANITAKALTMSGLSVPASKVYDGTTAAVVSGTPTLPSAETAGGSTADGKPYMGDTVSITGTATGTYNSKDVATATTVTFGGLALSGAQAGDYILTIQSPASATITAKTLTMSGLSVPASKVYDGTTTAVVSGTPTLPSAETAGGSTADGKPYTGDTVSIIGTATGAYNSKDVATGSSVTFAGLALSGAQAGDYILTIQSPASATITAKTLTMSGLSVPASKVYDGTTTAVVSGTPTLPSAETAGGSTADGKPYTGDTVSITGTATGAYNSKDVAAASTVTFTGLALTGAQAGDYSLMIQSAAAATITAKALTMSGLSVPASKVYDGTTAAVVSGTPTLPSAETDGGSTADGKPYTGDTVSITGTATGTYNSKDVAAATTVTFGGLSLTGAQAVDYSLTIQSPASATITAKTLLVSGLIASNKTYDATTTATLTGAAALPSAEAAGSGTTSDGKPYSGDTVALSGTAVGSFATKDAGSAVVKVTGNSLTGAQAGDYVLSSTNEESGLTANITAKTLTMSGLSVPASKVYDGTTTAVVSGTPTLPSAETAGGSTLDGKPYTGDTVSISGTATGTYNSKDVATATTVTFGGLSLSGATAGDYILTIQSPASATITAKAVTMSGLSVPASKVYGGTTTAVVSGTPALQSAEAAGGSTADGKPYTGDTVSITGTATGTYNSKDVATATTVTFGGLSLSGAQAGDYILTLQSPASATITAKTLLVSGLGASNKTYDATTTATLTGTAALPSAEAAGSGTTSDGKPYSGDTVSLSGTANGTFATKDAGSAVVKVTGNSLTGAQAGDYVLSSVDEENGALTATITAKAVTMSGLSVPVSKVYDGTTTAVVSGTPTLQSAEAAGGNTADGKPYTGDTVSISGTATGTYNSKDVATATTVTFGGLSLSGAMAGDYSLTIQSPAPATITAKALTYTGLSVPASKVYDGTTAAVVSGSAAVHTAEAGSLGTGGDGKPYTADTVNLSGTPTASYNFKDVATATTVTFGGLALTGAQAGDYALTASTQAAAITPQTLTAAIIGTPTKTYDGNTTASLASANFSLTGLVGSESFTVTQTSGTYNSPNAGSATTVTASLSAANFTPGLDTLASNYVLPTMASGPGAIVQANITPLVAVSDANGVYSGLAFAATATITPSDGPPSNKLMGVGITLTYYVGTGTGGTNLGSAAPINAGTYTVVASYAGAGQYLSAGAQTTFTITPKTLFVSGLSASNKTYDATTTATFAGTAALLTVEAAGGSTADGKPYTGDSVSLNSTAAAAFTGTFASKDVASGIMVTVTGNALTGAQAGDYVLSSTNEQSGLTANITAKALTVSGLSVPASKVYDGTTTAFVSGTPTLQSGETAGGSTTDGKPYTGDTVSITGTAIGTYNSKDVATATTVTFGGLSLTGAQAGDYILTIQSPASATITAKTLTMSGLSVPASKVYDGATTAFVSGTPSLQSAETAGGNVADGKPYTGDTVSITGTATGTYNSKDVASATTVTFGGLSLSGAQAGDYSLTIQSPASATITAKAVTMSGLSVPASKGYDGTTMAVVSGTPTLQSGETAGGSTTDGKPYTGDTVSISGTATGMYNSKDVATATTVTFGGLSLTGAQAGDYSLMIQSPASATITAKALTMSGLSAAASKVYDGTTTAFVSGTPTLPSAETAGGNTMDGMPYTGDTVFITGTATGTYNSKDVATATTATFGGLSLSGAQAGDYSLMIQSPASATITAKALTMSGLSVAANKVYDGTTTALVSGTPSLQSGETAGGSTADGKPYTGDTVSITGTATGTYNSKDVATATTVTFGGLSLSGAQAGDYSLMIRSPASATITAKALTMSGLSVAASKVYDGTTTALVSGTPSLQSAETAGGNTMDGKPYTGDTVSITGTATGTYNSKDVAAATTVTFGSLSLTGAEAGDYSLTIQSAAAATITAKALTMSGLSVAASKVYDGTTTALVSGTPTLPSAESTGGSSTTTDGQPYADDTVNITGTATGTYNSKDVATATTVTFGGLSLAGAQAGDYALTAATQATTITAKSLTYSGLSVAASKPYDGTTLAVVGGSATLQTPEAAGAGASSDGAPYSADSVSLTGTPTGTYNSKDVATANTVSFGGVLLTGAGSGNYALTASTQAATITPQTVNATIIGNPTKPFDGSTSAALTPANFSLAGLVGGDSFTVTQTTGTYDSADVTSATTVTANLSAGSFTPSTGTLASNYTLPTTASGAGAITPVAPTVRVSDSGGTYNGSAFGGVATVSGVNGQAGAQLEGVAATSVYHSGSSATGTVLPGAPIDAGTYTVVAVFPGSADYSSGASAPVTFTITPAAPTIALSMSPVSAVYGQPVTVTATLNTAAGTSGGSIGFLDGSTLLATVPLASGQAQATLTLPALIVGNHAIAAVYSGSSDFQGATSGSASVSIAKAATHVVLVPTVVLKRKKVISLSLTATVQPVAPGAGVPSGTLMLELMAKQGKTLKTVVLGTPGLNQGKATTALKPSEVMNKTITVIYNGDPNFQSTTGTQTLK